MYKIIAVDFDGTLCENRWPDIGAPSGDVIRMLIKRREEGDRLILWTCRSGEMLRAAVMWCTRQGLKFDAVNENLPEMIDMYGNDCRKVFADEYWDDKSVIVRTCEDPAVMQMTSGGFKLTRWQDRNVKTDARKWGRLGRLARIWR